MMLGADTAAMWMALCRHAASSLDPHR